MDEGEPVLLGLPLKCCLRVQENRVYLYSLKGVEHDVRGYAVDVDKVLRKVKLVETLNPCASGLRALRIKPNQRKELNNDEN